RWPWWLAGAAALLWLWAWWGLVTLPEDVLVTNVLVDDAFYFALPARHWWQGHGFSFDGIEPTNGVQTLWALVCIVLAGVCSEPLTMLRAMVGLSGLCWFAAAVALGAWLWPRGRGGALLAAVGFAFCGVHDRVAFQGMENGLHALVGALVLLAGARAVRRRWSTSATLLLGLTLALFGLSRTEGVLLGPMLALPLVCGWLGADGSFARRVATALVLAAPGVVLVGGACALSKLWFDSWLPISGSVKQFYESSWGGYDDPAHHQAGRGGLLQMAGWHFGFVQKLAIAPLRVHVPALLGDLTGFGYRSFRNVVWALLAIGGAAAVANALRRRGKGTPGTAIAWCFGVYALVHLVLIGLSLSHFTSYAKWYFASEVTAVWLLIGAAFAGFRGRLRAVPFALALLVAIAGLRDGGGVTHDVRTNRFKKAGEWLRIHAEPGAVIGALSAGLVGWYASDQHVVNLDGLINNRRYLDDYLKRDRFGEYFDDRGIEWFADYQPLTAWRDGISWRGNVPARRLAPRRYWRIPDAEQAYVVWRVLDEDANFELLGDDGPVVRDRHAELAVAADVHGHYPVVAHDALARRPGLVVARSIPAGLDRLLHVLVTPAQLDDIALTPRTVQPDHLEEVVLGEGLRALGYDVSEVRRGARHQLAVTLFWQRTDGAASRPVVHVATDTGQTSVPAGDCHGTLPLARWQAGQVVAE
ncbi:MAG: hypothetical protein KAI24_20625, partial [Planctomycetes bacterium]|nr:hypothetical protein [Planctomycetota bacterium]